MSVVSIAVGASSDDAYEIAGTVTTNAGSSGVVDATDEYIGLRFLNVTIPQGSTINTCTMEVEPAGTGVDEPLTTIYCENADNPGTFTTGASDISARSKTTGTAWDVADLGASGTSRHNTSDFSADLQTVVNRGGFASGNAVVVIIQGGATGTRDLQIKFYDTAAADAAILNVDYTASAGYKPRLSLLGVG